MMQREDELHDCPDQKLLQVRGLNEPVGVIVEGEVVDLVRLGSTVQERLVLICDRVKHGRIRSVVGR
jgi:hypothetical protein